MLPNAFIGRLRTHLKLPTTFSYIFVLNYKFKSQDSWTNWWRLYNLKKIGISTYTCSLLNIKSLPLWCKKTNFSFFAHGIFFFVLVQYLFLFLFFVIIKTLMIEYVFCRITGYLPNLYGSIHKSIPNDRKKWEHESF